MLVVYAFGLTGSLWAAYLLRFDFNIPSSFLENGTLIFGGIVAAKLLLLWASGQFESLLSFFGLHDALKLASVCAIAAVGGLTVWYLGSGTRYAPPRAVLLTDLLISFLFISTFRLALRVTRERFLGNAARDGVRRRVAIIGAGDVGANLARDLLMRRGLGMKPIAFFDDDPRKWSNTIHGVEVAGTPETLPDFVRMHKVDEVIIAMPNASGRRVRQIVALLNQLHLRFEIVPSYEQMLTGKVRMSQIRPVEIQDLLGRAPVNLATERIRGLLAGKVVMVTGAGGTIGGELCRQIASHGAGLVILVERSEFLLFQIEQELQELGFGATILPIVADILDPVRMKSVFARFKPAVVFHAAAHKHVPMMEHQPAEAFRNNAVGSKRLADLAAAHGVERFVLISTDKAINPTNVMGATKRSAELFLQAFQCERPRTKFMAVRFGNVLGSSGSVIPTFKRQIAAGGPVTVTHPDVTRYFMTVNEAVGLVLQSATLGEGGEIFVLDMGQPMKIADLARQLIELSGLEPDRDIEIQFTGLRPGEKLFEELNHSTENTAPTDHPKIVRLLGCPQPLSVIEREFNRLETELPDMVINQAKVALQTLVPEYTPHLSQSDSGPDETVVQLEALDSRRSALDSPARLPLPVRTPGINGLG